MLLTFAQRIHMIVNGDLEWFMDDFFCMLSKGDLHTVFHRGIAPGDPDARSDKSVSDVVSEPFPPFHVLTQRYRPDPPERDISLDTMMDNYNASLPSARDELIEVFNAAVQNAHAKLAPPGTTLAAWKDANPELDLPEGTAPTSQNMQKFRELRIVANSELNRKFNEYHNLVNKKNVFVSKTYTPYDNACDRAEAAFKNELAKYKRDVDKDNADYIASMKRRNERQSADEAALLYWFARCKSQREGPPMMAVQYAHMVAHVPVGRLPPAPTGTFPSDPTEEEIDNPPTPPRLLLPKPASPLPPPPVRVSVIQAIPAKRALLEKYQGDSSVRKAIDNPTEATIRAATKKMKPGDGKTLKEILRGLSGSED
jgi:hypothetical protein